MDDLKQNACNDGELEGLMKKVKAFIDDIGIEIGLDKCAKATFKRGKLESTDNLALDDEAVIKESEREGTYNNLGVNEGDGIQHFTMKDKIRKECLRRVRLLIKTGLNSQNKITPINSLPVPVVTYSLNVVNWNLSELRKLVTKIRKQFTCHRLHPPKSDIDRLYVPRNKGGRGMIQLELSYKTTPIVLAEYLDNSGDWKLHLVNALEKITFSSPRVS